MNSNDRTLQTAYKSACHHYGIYCFTRRVRWGMTVNERMTAGNSPLLHYCKLYYHREGPFNVSRFFSRYVVLVLVAVFDEFQQSHTTDCIQECLPSLWHILFYQEGSMTVNERMTAGSSPLLHYCKDYYHREGPFNVSRFFSR